jgi:hypothetical protein
MERLDELSSTTTERRLNVPTLKNARPAACGDRVT